MASVKLPNVSYIDTLDRVSKERYLAKIDLLCGLKLPLTKCKKKDAAGTCPAAPMTSIRLSLTKRKKRRCRYDSPQLPGSKLLNKRTPFANYSSHQIPPVSTRYYNSKWCVIERCLQMNQCKYIFTVIRSSLPFTKWSEQTFVNREGS